VVRNAGQHVSQIAFGINAIQLSTPDQTVDRRGTLSTAIGARKKKVLSAQSHDPQRSFGCIIVDFDAAVITEAYQRLPPS